MCKMIVVIKKTELLEGILKRTRTDTVRLAAALGNNDP